MAGRLTKKEPVMAYLLKKKTRPFGVRLALLIAAALMLNACVGSQSPILVKQWILEYPPPAVKRSDPLDVSLKLERFSAAMAYVSSDMVYSPAPSERAIYPYDRWRVSPADLVGDMFLRDLRNSVLFMAVLSPQQRGPARFRLEGGVEKFLEVDEGQNWQAVLAVTLTLIDTKQKRLPGLVVFQKNYQQGATIADKSAAGLAAAMGEAMARISPVMIKDVHQAVKKIIP